MTTPLDDPIVTIGNDSYTLKFSLLAQYLIDKARIDLPAVMTEMLADGPGKLAFTLDLFAAMVGNHYSAASKPVPTPEYWAGRIPEEAIQEVSKAVIAALKKWMVAQMGANPLPKQPPAPPVN